MAADQVLKRFARQIRKEDAHKGERDRQTVAGSDHRIHGRPVLLVLLSQGVNSFGYLHRCTELVGDEGVAPLMAAAVA